MTGPRWDGERPQIFEIIVRDLSDGPPTGKIMFCYNREDFGICNGFTKHQPPSLIVPVPKDIFRILSVSTLGPREKQIMKYNALTD